MKIAFIVEGFRDELRVKKAIEDIIPEVKFLVTNGTRIQEPFKEKVSSYIELGYHIILLTDPDQTGNEIADILNRRFGLPRIQVDKEEARKLKKGGFEYGIEHCDPLYLKKCITTYLIDSSLL